jgi:hypothetical protein
MDGSAVVKTRRGIFSTGGEKFASPAQWASDGPQRPWCSAIWGWSPSCCDRSEFHVFRAAIVSIALIVTAGQNAAVLCGVWCAAHEVAASDCHHAGASSQSLSLTGSERCSDMALGVAVAFVREDLRLGTSAADCQQAVVVAPFRWPPRQNHIRSGPELDLKTLLSARPLAIALRV